MRQRSVNSALTDADPTTSAMTPSAPNASVTAASPPFVSSAEPGRPVRMSESTARPPAAWAIHAAPMPERMAPTASKAGTLSGRPSAAWIAVALVLSAYAGSVVANASSPGSYPSGTAARQRRPDSTPIDVVSSS